MEQRYEKIGGKRGDGLYITSFCMKYITIYPGQTPRFIPVKLQVY